MSSKSPAAAQGVMVCAVPTLPVLDPEAATAFYCEKLGFRSLFATADYASVGRDQIEIHFWRCDDQKLPKASGCRIMVGGIDALYQEYDAKGVIHPKGQLASHPWGTREFVALDLDGNALRFAEEDEPGLS